MTQFSSLPGPLLRLAGLVSGILCWGASASAAPGTCVTTSHTASGPTPAVVLAGDPQLPTHPLVLGLGRCMRLELTGTARFRTERLPDVTLDAQGGQAPASWVTSPLVRLGLSFDTGRRLGDFSARAEYEHELLNGDSGGSDVPAGRSYPGHAAREPLLRKANLTLRHSNDVGLKLGFDTSHWGMGLLENDGAHDPEPGSARFSDPRGGDRILEARLTTGPARITGITAYLALQQVLDDEWVIAAGEEQGLRRDERSQRAVAGVQMGGDDLDHIATHIAWRRDESATGAQASYGVFDASAVMGADAGDGFLVFEAELAYQHGRTDLAATSLRAPQDLRAFGASFRTTFSLERVTTALDLLFASGDSDPDDGVVTGFRADKNYEMGVVLFRQVISAQSARSVATAGGVAGAPIRNTERIADDGRIGNSIVLFPRLGYRLLPGLDAYAGVLFAFAAVTPTDAANARVAGGAAQSVLGATPGGYWGTEYDLGARFRGLLWGSLLTVGGEVGVAEPGSAMRGGANPAVGAGQATAVGARAFANYDF